MDDEMDDDFQCLPYSLGHTKQMITMFRNYGVSARFPEEYSTFYFEIDATIDVQEMYVITKNDGKFHRTKILVKKVDFYDYWQRHKIYGDMIFFSDYSGMKVYNSNLNILYRHDLSNNEIENGDVFCFRYNYERRRLMMWLASDRSIEAKMRNDYHNMHGVDRTKIIEIIL
jgi:hypothetical protein